MKECTGRSGPIEIIVMGNYSEKNMITKFSQVQARLAGF